MKIKTIKKNNNPRNITTKHNKKTKKKTNKKGKSNILKKTKKINRKNKKLLIGGAYGKYNENFFSVELDDNFKTIDKNSFLYQFMEKYIENLNPETNIPNEFVYEKYRNYKKKYDSKLDRNKPYFQDPRPKILQKGQPNYLIKSMNWLIDTYENYYKEQPITQNLRDIRLDYYLKTVASIMTNDQLKNLKINSYKPNNLYTKINDIKTNYDTNIKSKLEEKDKKNTYYINCHGGYSKIPITFTVPENVMIHFLTPLNYISYPNVNESRNLRENLTKISKNTDNTINNIKELLKIDCFQNMITFLPSQKCVNINLSIALKDEETFHNTLGIYNITSDDSSDKTIKPYIFDQYLSYLIQNNIPKSKSDSITNIYINCCRSCNNEVDNLSIENMYIYENFIKQLNNLLLEIDEKDIEIDEVVCPNSMALKVLSIEKSPRNNTRPAFNGYLSQKKDKTKSPKINKIIELSKNLATDQNKEQLSKLINSTEFTDNEFENLFNYLTDKTKVNIIDIIHDNLDTSKQKKFINDVYIKSSTNEHFLIILNHLLNHLKKTYSNLDINLMNSIGNTALHNAVLKKLEIVELLLAQDKIEVNIPNNEGDTPLHNAVLKNKLEIVKLLLEHQKIDVNIPDNKGNTPLYYAVLENKIEIVKLLLAHEDIEVNRKSLNMTPLLIASFLGYTEIVKLLLKHKKIYIDIDSQDLYGETPEIIKLINNYKNNHKLHKAVLENNIKIVKSLLEEYPDIDVNIQNAVGDTSLHLAVLENAPEIVKLLLAHPDINVNIKNKDGNTPLQLTKNDEIIELIKTHKSSSQ